MRFDDTLGDDVLLGAGASRVEGASGRVWASYVGVNRLGEVWLHVGDDRTRDGTSRRHPLWVSADLPAPLDPGEHTLRVEADLGAGLYERAVVDGDEVDLTGWTLDFPAEQVLDGPAVVWSAWAHRVLRSDYELGGRGEAELLGVRAYVERDGAWALVAEADAGSALLELPADLTRRDQITEGAWYGDADPGEAWACDVTGAP